MTERTDRPVPVTSRRPAAFARMSFAIAGVCLGVAGVSAIAVAAICLPPPHGRSVFATALRPSIAPAVPAAAEIDVARTWREEWAHVAGLGLRAVQDNSWLPEGGLSTLLATRFPSSGHVRIPGDEVATRLPPPRPEGIAQQDIADQSVEPRAVVRNVPVVSEPQLASLPPQPKSEGIFEKLFGDPDRAAKAVLAANPKTVLYDIARRAVYLPDGERLEAHSGFGKFMDDPQSIERRDVGVTPPNVYAVSFREKPFHGVRALRMKPVGTGNMYGRDGILAHSYLLGEAGASNGCISVRDYDKFVQAYEAGKFDRIIVLRSAEEPVPAMVASAQGNGA